MSQKTVKNKPLSLLEFAIELVDDDGDSEQRNGQQRRQHEHYSNVYPCNASNGLLIEVTDYLIRMLHNDCY